MLVRRPRTARRAEGRTRGTGIAIRDWRRDRGSAARSGWRRLTVDIGILRRRAASEKLLASTTLANTTSELRSAIALPKMENSFSDIAVCGARGCSHGLAGTHHGRS